MIRRKNSKIVRTAAVVCAAMRLPRCAGNAAFKVIRNSASATDALDLNLKLEKLSDTDF